MSDAPSARRVSYALLLQRLRWQLLCNGLDVMLRRSFIRLLTIFLCSLVIWGTLFVISFIGFHELRGQWHLNLDEQPIAVVFNLSFVVLSVLLVFSTGIILYSSLYSSRESNFLLMTPIPADQIFAYKFQGAVAFSSWAFLLLGSPVLLAYGLEVAGGAPWYYYLLIPLYFLGFVLLPGSAGALLCLLLVSFFPRHRKQVLFVGGLLLACALAWWGYMYLWPSARQLFLVRSDALEQFLGNLSLVHSPFVPAYWLAEGVRAAALWEWETALYYLALIWSNGLFLYVVTAWVARRLYRRGFNLLASSGGLRRSYGTNWMDRCLSLLLHFIDRQTRTLILKDFRSFRRDPSQWAQILILLGLAALYLYNMREFYRQDIGRPFQNGISLLNLVATSLGLCAFTGRFIYPMLSLEGSKFWILGLLPLQRRRLIWGKFAFSAVATVLIGEFLVLFSDIMLNLPWQMVAVHGTAILLLALGLSGLCVGMGAAMPNFRETDPSKIAVGFGGTVTLIMGLMYQVLLIVVLVGPWHMLMAAQDNRLERMESLDLRWLALSAFCGLLLAGTAIVMPLRVGARALERMEF